MSAIVRPARDSDADVIATFTAETWPDRQTGDYLPDVIHDWIATDNDDQQTLVAEWNSDVVGVLQVVLLSKDEAWCQGMRVHPAYRGHGIGMRLTEAGFNWARDHGASVARNMVFSWNTDGLGLSRAVGFEPTTVFRWAYPSLDSTLTNDAILEADPAVAWDYWTRSEAYKALNGLSLDRTETWALSTLTRDDLVWAADETALLRSHSDDTQALSYRTRDFIRDSDSGSEHVAEYGVAAWTDVSAAKSVFSAIAADAIRLQVDRARVLIPETPRIVSDAVFAGSDVADAPDFVFEADLTIPRNEQ